ncbi:MAG: LuxR family transcriptional regulator [Calothrix sp. C42_A2020_038]|nr:LuxR family transcriptional regulator [Calothrix sp. C42_A2020_038]
MELFDKHNHNTTSTKRNRLDNNFAKDLQPSSHSHVYILRAVIECFVDGILVLTQEQELLHANEYAREICSQLEPGIDLGKHVPQEIKYVCESLIESRELFPGEKIFIELETEKNKVKVRIRARWLKLDENQENYIIVTLENYNELSQSMAMQDAKKYGLTERETQVWLLRKANLTYKEIAARLYITINTVKKHLKNIYAKQHDMMWLESSDFGF